MLAKSLRDDWSERAGSTSSTHNFFMTRVAGVNQEYVGSISDESIHRIHEMKE